MNTQYRKNLKAVLEASKTYCDESIDSLKWELGTYDLSVGSDTTSAYQKVVPVNSIEAKINTLGGMSYKSKNKANVQDTNETTDGVNITTISQHIVVSGTSVSNNAIFVNGILTSLPIGTYTLKFFGSKLPTGCYVFDGTVPIFVNDGNSVSITLGFGKDYFQFNTTTGTTYDYDFYIMLVSGTTIPTTFEPYYSGIRDIAPTSVKSVGFNQFNAVGRTAGTYDSSNPSFSDEKYYNGFSLNGQYYASGTATLTSTSEGNVVVSVVNAGYGVGFPIKVIAGQTYHIDFTAISDGYVGCFFVDYSGNITNGSYSNVPYNVNIPNNCEYLVLVFGANATGTHTFSNINVNISNASLNGTYKPYFTASLLIPAQVQALDGYGWGVNSTCYNYIDFNAKKFIKKANKYTFTGNEVCNKIAGTTPMYRLYLVDAKDDSANALLTSTKWHMQVVILSSASGTWGVEIQNGSIYFQPPSDVITTEAQLLADITGLTIEYEMTTPVETDISAYLTTNKITVEGGGTLTAENTYGASVPSDIDYLKEVAK